MKNYKKALLLAVLLLPFVISAEITENQRYGNSNPQVMELQEFLIDKGFLQGSATGNFFSLTKKAVMAYQTQQGLPSTGFVGVLTREKINAELAGTVSEEEKSATAVVTPSNDTQTIQKTLADLIAQVQALQAQQKALADAQTVQTTQTQQTLSTIAQNTTPQISVGSVPPPPVDKSDILVKTIFATSKKSGDPFGEYIFIVGALDKGGNYIKDTLIKIKTPPDDSYTKAVESGSWTIENFVANTEKLPSYTPMSSNNDCGNYTCDSWSVTLGYVPQTSGTKEITFTAGSQTKTITIEVK